MSIISNLCQDAVKIFNHVEKLTSLHKFIWTANPELILLQNYSPQQRGLLDLEFQESTVEMWFRTLPHFDVAYFSFGPQRNHYAQWSRGSAKPRLILCDDFKHFTPFHDITLDHRLLFCDSIAWQTYPSLYVAANSWRLVRRDYASVAY